jgi:lysophospholipase L1-like esterase
MKHSKYPITLLLLLACAGCAGTPAFSEKFVFDPASIAEGYTPVPSNAVYSKELGYGFEPGAVVQEIGGPPVICGNGHLGINASFVTSGNIFRFSVAVPEGNYKVTVTLGDGEGESTTTVKAESRRLMLERIHTARGEFVTRSFLVSVRRPQLPDGRMIKLDVQEVNAQGELTTPTWDDKLTLQFSDARPCVDAIEIESVAHPVTVFLMSDSTVTDQRGEPYGTWGQMLPRWFKPPVVIVNYAESGETLKAFRAEHRWDKILSQIKPGDYVFMQFGTNDLNKGDGTNVHNAIWPADDHAGDWANTYVEGEDYKNLLKQYAAEAKARGAIPVIVSPMTKIDRQTGAINFDGLRNYPKDAIDAAKEAGVAYIDLNAMSVDVWTALGPQLDIRGTVDGLHSNTYGGYLLSRCIVEGIKQDKLDLVKYLVDDAGNFDPKHPQPLPDDFKIPLEPRGGRAGGAPRGAAPSAPVNPPSAGRSSPPPSN